MCIAGLSDELFYRVQKTSAKKFAPHGHLILQKLGPTGYSRDLARQLIGNAANWLRQQAESLPISFVLLYVDHKGEELTSFLECFFPFALTTPIKPINLSQAHGRQAINSAFNEFEDTLLRSAHSARRKADEVSLSLKDEHRTPLLLPVRNFQSDEFRPLLKDAYHRVGEAENVSAFLQETFKNFQRTHQTTFERNVSKRQRCFTDQNLYFIGPGRDRHGYFRHSAKGHSDQCVLTARSRLGGRFDHSFHFDCQPVHALKASYCNCHDEDCRPKPTHVNIAPNDYVI